MGLRGEGTPFRWRAKEVPSPLKLPQTRFIQEDARRGGAGVLPRVNVPRECRARAFPAVPGKREFLGNRPFSVVRVF